MDLDFTGRGNKSSQRVECSLQLFFFWLSQTTLFLSCWGELSSCDASHSFLLFVMEYDLSVARARDPLIAITVFAFIALLSTGMRLGSRRIRQLSFAKDDYLMVAALVWMIPRRFLSSNWLILNSSACLFPLAFNSLVSNKPHAMLFKV